MRLSCRRLALGLSAGAFLCLWLFLTGFQQDLAAGRIATQGDGSSGNERWALGKHPRKISSVGRSVEDDDRDSDIRKTSRTQSKHSRPGNRSPSSGQNTVSVPDRMRKTELHDIFIGVKTTEKYHRHRMDLLMDTWVSLAKDQTFVFTDSDDEQLRSRLGDHLINTNCSSSHMRQALCCKMAVEYDMFLQQEKRWFCHVDDDNYLNVHELVKLLNQYKHTDDIYLGRPSINHPMETYDRHENMQKVNFWFATGGAGFCISKGLALKMIPYASGGKFMSSCERIRLPDDCTLGFIIERLLRVKLVQIQQFHSHLEWLKFIKKEELPHQVSLSYGLTPYRGSARNVIGLDEVFSESDDPTRFKSLHCLLYPYVDLCSGHVRTRR
ncbi:beta-1,3-N-acetylglucosaminyltransferase lunatic fringe-like [Branchiostoma floridae]|uniref:Beta-1,3-N-acetylglucosaminyltransferase n=1 Tax=Branchiostoma floridae TaxID=7739 RepID=A0A9J7M650_BRAFL|nr:beta-1,3-N-acetylglucosaminyltransferase lunatic fringe-like [Branchiostoma floridae]